MQITRHSPVHSCQKRIFFQPMAPLTIIPAISFDKFPERSGMVHLLQMAQFMDENILPQRRRKHDQPPIQTYPTVRVATAPPSLEITHGNICGYHPRSAGKLKHFIGQEQASRPLEKRAHGFFILQQNLAVLLLIAHRPVLYGFPRAVVEQYLPFHDVCKFPARLLFNLFQDPAFLFRHKASDEFIGHAERRADDNLSFRNGYGQRAAAGAYDPVTDFTQSRRARRRRYRRRS